MNRKYRLLGLTLILCLACQGIVAQTVSRTSYFMENATHRHLMNPALAPIRGYLSIPVAGEFSMGNESNLQFTNFIYPANEHSDGLPVTFLHPSVSGADFIQSINSDQYLRTDIRTSILSYGRWIGRTGFLTFDVATRANLSLNLPQDFFSFAKLGMTNRAGTTYYMDNLNVNASLIAEGALGYSVNLTEAIRIGAKGKFLAGGAMVKANMKQMELTMAEDNWSVTSQGQLDVYGHSFAFKNNEDGNVNGFELPNPGLGGMGMAFDLGMEWSPIQNLRFSVAVIDFGTIKWKKENIKTAAASGSTSFSGVTYYDPDEVGQLTIEEQIESLKTTTMELAGFKEQVVAGDYTQKMNPTINAGAEIALMSNRVSLGGLYTTKKLDNGEQYTEYMASLNLKPFHWFNLSGSYSFLKGQKETFGFALGFVPGIINIFIACDYVPTKYGALNASQLVKNIKKDFPIFIPLNALTTNIQLGISIPLGRRPVKQVEDDEDLDELPVSDEIPPQY